MIGEFAVAHGLNLKYVRNAVHGAHVKSEISI